jgi:hypothetical protein
VSKIDSSKKLHPEADLGKRKEGYKPAQPPFLICNFATIVNVLIYLVGYLWEWCFGSRVDMLPLFEYNT